MEKKELEQMQDQANWAGFMLDLPFASKPGEKFSYCSGNFYLLAEILQRASKMKCHDFARKYLFDVLQFSKTYWDENKNGVNHGWGDLYTTPYDMAKIGSLLLQEGKWNAETGCFMRNGYKIFNPCIISTKQNRMVMAGGWIVIALMKFRLWEGGSANVCTEGQKCGYHNHRWWF